MGIRPNKTNFGLSFGDLGKSKREEEKRRRREEEEEEEKKGMETMFLYGDYFCMDSSIGCYDDFVWNTMGFVWIISRV